MFRRLLMFLLFILPYLMNGQGVLGRLKNRVQQTAENALGNKADEAIYKEVDKLGKNQKPTPEEASSGEEDAVAIYSDAPVPEQPATEPVAGEVAVSPTGDKASRTETNKLQAYSKFDFVPGEQVIYYEDFSEENIGELPFGWNTTGTAEVVTMSHHPGWWLQLFQEATFLTDNTRSFGENFSLEFDLLINPYVEFNGSGYPDVYFGFLASGNIATTDNALLDNMYLNFLVSLQITPGINGGSYTQLLSNKGLDRHFSGDIKTYTGKEELLGHPIHVAVQVQGERIRIWFDENKLYDVPRCILKGYDLNQLFFKVYGSGYSDEELGVYVTNIRIASGVADSRHQLLEKGRFSTSGILFEVNAATLKGESYGVIKEIATVLRENPGMRIGIIGHTDADGDEKDNQLLSEKRAGAVKEALMSNFGIDAGRISTSGKGESQPVADNRTANGKAQNRRVEFVRL